MLPLELPRRLLLRMAAVLAVVCLAAAGVGAWRAAGDADDEMRSAMALAATVQWLATAAARDDAALLGELSALQRTLPLRHLHLRLLDEHGVVRHGAATTASTADAVAPPLVWPVARPHGATWTGMLSASPDSERREARDDLLATLALFAGGALLVLGLLHWQLVGTLRPLRLLLAAIERPRPGLPLPAMPVRELQVLADALQRAQAQREQLGRRLQTLQEDERRWLAQELHDELGQRLTALRIDAAVLGRMAATPALTQLAAGLSAQAEAAQREVRSLLARLAPRDDDGQPARLQDLLIELAAAQSGLKVDCVIALGEQPLPAALAMALYRLSQEGLTNVRRHADAHRAWLLLRRDGDRVHWSLRDDGCGLADPAAAFARGSGLAGMRERSWAWGGDLGLHDAAPGLQLSATLRVEAAA